MADYNFIKLAKNAKIASKKLATIPSNIKNQALLAIAEALDNNKAEIIEANKKDLELAKDNVSLSVYNRLKLDQNKMRDMIQGIIDVCELDDPIGKI